VSVIAARADKELSFFDISFQETCIFPDLPRDPYTSFELFYYAGKQQLELLEVFTNGAVGDFLGGALISGGANVAKIGDVRRARRTL
jgi:hypothetical protein